MQQLEAHLQQLVHADASGLPCLCLAAAHALYGAQHSVRHLRGGAGQATKL